jgi:hypothetical protein
MPDLLGDPAPGEVVYDIGEPGHDVPLSRAVGRGDALSLDCGVGDLAGPDRPLIAERFVNPLRDFAASEPFRSPGMPQQRRDALGIGCGVEQPQRGVQVDQLAPETVYFPAVHFDIARDLRALVAERVDGYGLFVGEGQRELWHPAIFGYAAAGSNCAVVALAT